MKIKTVHVVVGAVALAAAGFVAYRLTRKPAVVTPGATPPAPPAPPAPKQSWVDKAAGYVGLGLNLFGQGKQNGLW